MAKTESSGVTLVDANVRFDVLGGDPQWDAWSRAALNEARDRAEVAINPPRDAARYRTCFPTVELIAP